MRHTQQEHIHAALALLLGPETEYHTRVRATRRLIRQGPAILPLLLTTLNNYPEITAPAWPWWPPQYEHCSRLLLYLCRQAQINLEEILQHPTVASSVGPVLWTGIIEAVSLVPHIDYEHLLCQGLATDWMSVRYAATMALAKRSNKTTLHTSTLEVLRSHLGEEETFPVRLTASYALLNSGEAQGLDILLQLMGPRIPHEVRKAATFILATELPLHLSSTQREQIVTHLMDALYDPDLELALQAAHALSHIASPSIVPAVVTMVTEPSPQIQLVILTLLEELSRHKTMRHVIRHLALPKHIVPLLRSEIPELRRQASYTLAACGGEYVAAVLGTIVLNSEHPGHIETIECLRLLHGGLRAPLREHIVRWLLCVLNYPQELALVTALDSLAHLLWQAHMHRQKLAWQQISQEIIQNGMVVQLLQHESAWVRQRALELLMQLASYLNSQQEVQKRLQQILLTDTDSGVRACAAYICGQLAARWALPALIQVLLDPDEHVASTALTALEQVANADDLIVVYILQELAHNLNASDSASHMLARKAQAILKKWQKVRQSKTSISLQ